MEFFAKLEDMGREERQAYLQEGLILDVAEQIWSALAAKGISRKDLAEALGTSTANVSRQLNGSRNMTLRTLSDISDALNCDVNVELRDRDTGNGWVHFADWYSNSQRVLWSRDSVKAANDWEPMAVVNG